MRHSAEQDLGGTVCFAVEAAPPECCTSEPAAFGCLRMETKLMGRVVHVDDGAFEIEHGARRVRVRYLLPRAVDLASLVGQDLSIAVVLSLDPSRAPTVDTTIRALDGRLLLWARDGALPSDRAARPQVRVTHSDSHGRRLAINLPRGLLSLRQGECSAAAVDDGTATICAVRVDDDDAAFVFVVG